MIFFNEAKPPSKVQITHNRTIGIMAFIKGVVGKPCFTPGHGGLCVECSWKCAAVVMGTVLFTDGIIHEDYQAMAELVSLGTSKTCQRTVSVLQLDERGQ